MKTYHDKYGYPVHNVRKAFDWAKAQVDELTGKPVGEVRVRIYDGVNGETVKDIWYRRYPTRRRLLCTARLIVTDAGNRYSYLAFESCY